MLVTFKVSDQITIRYDTENGLASIEGFSVELPSDRAKAVSSQVLETAEVVRKSIYEALGEAQIRRYHGDRNI